MNRREALQLLATSAALPLVPSSLLAALRQARSVVGTHSPESAFVPSTLSPRQVMTVKAMAELILPGLTRREREMLEQPSSST